MSGSFFYGGSMAKKTKDEIEDIREDNPKARIDYELKESVGSQDTNDGKKLNLDIATKGKVLSDLDTLIGTAQTAMGDRLTRFRQADKDYDGKIPQRSFPHAGASSIGIPVVKTKIRQLVRKLSRPLLKNRPIMPLEPQEQSDVERVEKAEKFLDSEGKKVMKLGKVIKPVIKDTGKYGTGLIKLPFVVESEKKTQHEVYHGDNPEDVAKFDELYPDAITKNPEYFIPLHSGEKVEFESVFEKETYRGPRPERINRKNFVTPAGYTDIEKMPFWFEKITKSWSDLEDDVKNGLYEQEGLDKIKRNYLKKKDPLEYIKKQYTVHEGLWMYPYNNVKQKCLFSVILNEKAYLRGIKYPYDHGKPYIIPFKIIDDPDNFDGEAIAYDLSDNQKLQNMIFNTTIDADVANYPTFKAKKTSKRNFDLERWYPLKVWWVDDMGEFEQMQSGSGKASSSFQLMDRAVRMGDDVSGLSELLTGRESSGDPNAPGNKTAMLLGETDDTMSEYLETFLIGWNEMVYQICELYSQYGTQGKEFRVINEAGEPSFEAAPDDLRVRPDMESHGGEAMFSRSGQKQAILGLMAGLKDDPIVMSYMQRYPQGWIKLWLKAIENWGAGIGKEAETMIPSEEFIQQEQVKIQVLAMQEMKRIEDEKEELRSQNVPEDQIEAAAQELSVQNQPELQEAQ